MEYVLTDLVRPLNADPVEQRVLTGQVTQEVQDVGIGEKRAAITGALGLLVSVKEGRTAGRMRPGPQV